MMEKKYDKSPCMNHDIKKTRQKYDKTMKKKKGLKDEKETE